MKSIYDIQGNLLMQVPVTAECEHAEELMRTDEVRMFWNAADNATLPDGAYVEVPDGGEKYYLVEPYQPTQKKENMWRYEPVFVSRFYALSKVPFYMYTYEGGDVEGEIISREADWALTTNPDEFMRTLCRAIKNETGEKYTYAFGQDLPASATVTFSSVDIISALNAISNAFKTEFWLEKYASADASGNIGKIHLSIANDGETPKVLTVGGNINVPSITDGREGFYNRFVILGSNRNITQEYQGAGVNSIANKRLTLDPTEFPDGYIDFSGTRKPFTKILTFDEIYPSASDLVITNVRARVRYVLDDNGNRKTVPTPSGDVDDLYTIWYFQLKRKVGNTYVDFDFDDTTYDPDDNPDGMMLPGMKLSIHFNSGPLSGREFELTYHKEGGTTQDKADTLPFTWLAGDFEINYVTEGTYIIPAQTGLVPQDDNYVVLFNIRMPDDYVEDAQLRLRTAAFKEISEKYLKLNGETPVVDSDGNLVRVDMNSYQFSSNPVAFGSSNPNLTIGAAVRYVNGGYTHDTRVTALTTKLDFPIKQTITIGNERVIGTIRELQEQATNANQNIDLLAALNESTKQITDAYTRTQQMILSGMADDFFEENQSLATLVQLKSAYSYIGTRKGLVFDTEADPTNSPAHLMVINKGTAQNPNLVLYSPLPLITGGDQIVIDGDPQGGGGGGGATTLYSLLDIYGHENEVVKRADGTSRSNGDLLAFDSSKGNGGMWVALPQNTITPDLSNYYTKTQTDTEISSAITALNLGAAATYGVGSVASGNTGLVTGGSVYSAINEAVSSALKFQGITTTAISDGSTTNPITINNQSYTAKMGDVVLYDGKEYLWTGSAWEQLGDEASWALKTTTITAGTGLTGGGTLAANRTISLSQATQDSLALADSAYQKPSAGIPKTDLASGVQTSLSNADSAYQKPSTGIPQTDLASALSTKVDNGSTAYGYFSNGILPYNHGGTGISSYTKGNIIYASANNTLAKLAPNTGAKQFLTMTSSVPSWDGVDETDVFGSSAIGSASLPIYYTGSALATITSLDLLSKNTGYIKGNRFYLSSDIFFEYDSDHGYVTLNAPFVTSGDQIVIDGTPGGGGGGGGATNLKELEDVYHNASGVRRYSSGNVGNTDLLGYDSTKGWYAVQLGTGLSMTNGVLTATNTSTGTVTQVKVGSTAYNPTDGVVSLPAYPTTLPASDVSAWAKASTKPSYAFSEITGTASASQIPSTVAYQSQPNNFVHSTNEWTVIPSGYTGNLWLNYRTVGGSDGSLTNYSMGNGASGYASVTASSFIKNGGTSSQFLKADGSVDSNTYLTGITSTMVTTALGYTPANSTALSNYVLKAGDTMTGILTLNHTYANPSRMKFVDARVTGTTGGWADVIISIHSADESTKASMGWYGNGATPEFVYFGFADYYGKNLRIYPDGTLALGNGTNGSTVSQKYDIYHQGNLTKSVLTTLLESDSGYYVKKSGDTMSGALTVNSSLSATGTVTLGSESSCVLFLNRKNNPNYIWASNTGGYLAFGVVDKGSTNLANSTLVVNNYGIGVGGNTSANSTAALNVTGNAVVSGSVKIGSATISWNSNGYLHIDKPLVTAGDQIVISGTPGGGGGGGATNLWGLDDVNIPHDSTYPGNGDLLSYDLSTHKWVNVAASTVGGVTSVAGRTGVITLTTSDITNIETWISGKGYITSYTDTKNTTGADNTTSKIFLVGPTAQTTSNGSARTYSNSNCYASGGYLYSGGSQVLTSHQTLYNLVINNSAGTAQITYKPGTSGTYSLTLTKAMVGLGSVENTALSTWAGTTNITTLGTITSGTWSGSTIAVNKGGTGKTSWTQYGVVYASATTTLAQVSNNTTTTRKFLRQVGANNAATAPAWDTVTKTDVGLSNVENTALSTWAGTSNITTLGTITTGVWHGSAIGNSYLANSTITINGSSTSLGGSFSTASITAGTAGQSGASTGVSFSIPYVTMNKYGIVTAYGTHTHTISASDLTTTIGSTTYAAYHAAGYVKKDGDTMSGALTPASAQSGVAWTCSTLTATTTSTRCIEFSNVASSAGNGGYIDFHYNGSTADYTSRIIEIASGKLLVYGDLGIGTTPSYKLHVIGSVGCGAITSSGVLNITGATGYSHGIRIHDSESISSVWFRAVNASGYDAGMWGITAGDTGFRFRGPASKTATTPNDYVTIAHGGNVGIGTTSPSYKLDVNGQSRFFGTSDTRFYGLVGGAGITLNVDTSQYTGGWNSAIRMGADGTSVAGIAGLYSTGADPVMFWYGGTSQNDSALYILWSTKYVGIGTSAPSQKLHVAGTILSTGDQVVSSDLTLKDNLAPVTYSVSDIAKARAVEFDWRDGRGHSMGSIAQDWLGIAPALVHGEEGNMSLAYGQLALVNTILLARQSESHEERIAKLEKENAELKEEVKRLRMN